MTLPGTAPGAAIDLHRSEGQRLAALLGQDMAGVLELSLDARVLRVNNALCHITGFSPEALLGLPFADCVPREDWPLTRATLDALVSDGASGAVETRLHCRDGGLVWVSSLWRLLRTEAGEPAGFMALVLDISASVRMRERLGMAEERLRLALEGARMGVWAWDLLHDRLECSEVALDCLGLAPGTRPSLGDVFVQVHADDRARVQAALQAALDSLEPLDIEFRIRLRDGSERWLVLMARASCDAAGQPGGMHGLVGDVSERKAQEALLEHCLADNLLHTREVERLSTRLAQRAVQAETATRTRDALLRNVGHELRTPLNHISGSLDILLSGELPAPGRRWAETAREAAGSLARIIDGVMEVARLAAGDVQEVLRDFAPSVVLSEVAALLSRRAAEKGLAVHFAVAAEVPRWVLGDGVHVAQVLLNFFDNALKFTPQGSITLGVSVATGSRPGTWLRFAVRDTGIGIDGEMAKRLFEPFVQGDDSVTRPYGGLGIGLSNARKLAAVMGGAVGVESRAGEGSTFWLEVPVQEAHTEHLLLPAAGLEPEGQPVRLGCTPEELAHAVLAVPALREQLSTDDIHAKATVEAAAAGLRTLFGDADFERLRRQIAGFDFPAALQVLGEIEARLARPADTEHAGPAAGGGDG